MGVLAPEGIDGLGASLLLLAYVTAFYDRYRESGKEFFAYPDYFTFQRRTPTACYSMLDIWPGHKDVEIRDDPGDTLNAILDRAINVLAVPLGTLSTTKFSPVQMASARRTIRQCYTYSTTGKARGATLVVACDRPEPLQWAHTVMNSLPPDDSSLRKYWISVIESCALPEQSFTEISLDEALALL